MGTETLWDSASALKAYVACPAKSALPFEEVPAMIAGTIRHSVMEEWYKTGKWIDPKTHARFKEIPADLQADVCEVMEVAKDKENLFPPRDWVLSIEGSDLPPAYRCQAHGRNLFKVQVTPTVGLRGSTDLVCLNPEDPGTLIIPDWKGRMTEDHDIQAAVYAVTHAIMFRGFDHYEFRAISLGRWTVDTYKYPAAEMPAVTKYLESLVRQKASDKVRFPRRCQWCGSCPLRSGCPLFESALMAADGKTAAPRSDLFPTMPLSDLLRVQKEMGAVEKIASGIKDEAKAEMVKRLKDGPQMIGTREYVLKDKVSRWYVTEDDAAFALAKKLGLELGGLLALDVGAYRDACEKAIKAIDDPMVKIDLDAEYKSTLRCTTYKDIQAKVVE